MDVNGTFQSERQKTRIDGIETSLGYKVNDDHRLKLGYSHIQDGMTATATAAWTASWTG